MCKLCEIEHSARWTCAQARANQEDWLKTDVQTIVHSEPDPLKGRTYLDRSEKMKAWWERRKMDEAWKGKRNKFDGV